VLSRFALLALPRQRALEAGRRQGKSLGVQGLQHGSMARASGECRLHLEIKSPDWDRHERAEALLESSGADIRHDQADRAFYL